MSYHFNTQIESDMTTAEEKVREALKAEGFGVLTEIDVKATFKKKIDKDIYPYKILGTCNPGFAFQAIDIEPEIGVMLPCNIILTEKKAGTIDIYAIDPVASMIAVPSEELMEIAKQVQKKLQSVISNLN